MGLAECKGRRDGGKEGRRDGGTEGRTEGRREGGFPTLATLVRRPVILVILLPIRSDSGAGFYPTSPQRTPVFPHVHLPPPVSAGLLGHVAVQVYELAALGP